MTNALAPEDLKLLIEALSTHALDIGPTALADDSLEELQRCHELRSLFIQQLHAQQPHAPELLGCVTCDDSGSVELDHAYQTDCPSCTGGR